MRAFTLSHKLVALFAAAALAACLGLSGCASQPEAAENNGPGVAEESADAPAAGEIEVTVSVAMPDNGMAESQTSKVAISADGTVWDALEATGWDVQAEDGQYGKFVTGINGAEVTGSTGWVFTVNGQPVDVGASEATLAAGDEVQWELVSF